MNDLIPIFYACDDNFIKYTIVSLTSMIENADKTRKYQVYILHTGISEEMQKETLKLENEHFKIDFVDVIEHLDQIKEQLPLRDYYSKTTYYRLFIAEMYPEYNKAIYIDSDTIVKGDISQLFDYDVKDYFVGACKEQVMIQTDVYGTYVEKVMGISRHQYFNAGLMLMNCEAFRKHRVLKQFIELLSVYTFVVTQDEDYLNVICQDKVLWLDASWNVEVYGTLPVKESEINIIHYIMVAKPWHYADCRLKEYFWQYAKKTSILPFIKDELNNYTDEQRQNDAISCEKLAQTAIAESLKEDTYLAKRKNPERLEILKRIEKLEAEGRFDEDVEDDPPTKELLPHQVDYLRKKISSRMKTKYAYYIARKYLNHIIKEKQFIVKEIIGIENFQNLESGAVITCNHFNALDSFAIQLAYENSLQKKRKFYRVIREGNYTSFPGFYGFLMRNCNTLPLSSNATTMKKFIRSTNQLLQDGHFVLFYPEQSMWWNYRKPKPLKDGAYRFAVHNKVPVLPCFITMRDTDLVDENGFFIQEYTIHIEKPIYLNQQNNQIDNIQMMKERNYQVWKNIYEQTYNMPLVYHCK